MVLHGEGVARGGVYLGTDSGGTGSEAGIAERK